MTGDRVDFCPRVLGAPLPRQIAACSNVLMLDDDTAADVEGDAAALAKEGGYEDDEQPDARALCVRLLGCAPLFAPMRTEASLVTVAGSFRIYVRRGTPAPKARWLALHEVGEWHYRRRGYTGADLEERCNLLASALTAPRRVYRALVARFGSAHTTIARQLGTTQSVAFLRDSEVFGKPAMLVRATGVIVRGAAFVWPDLSLAAAKRLRHASVSKARITDEPRRVGLRAA